MPLLVCFAKVSRGLLAPMAFTAIFPPWKGEDALARVESVFTLTKNKTSIFQVNLRSKGQLSFPQEFLYLSHVTSYSHDEHEKESRKGFFLKFSQIWGELSICYKAELQKQG